MSTVDVTDEEQVACRRARIAAVEPMAGLTTLFTSLPQQEPESELTGILSAPIVEKSSTRRRGKRSAGTPLKTQDLFIRFEQEISTSHAMTSARREKMAFRSLSRLLGHVEANKLGPHEAYEYSRARAAEGIAAGTVDYELRLLRQVFSTARTLWGDSYRMLQLPAVRGRRVYTRARTGIALAQSDVDRLLGACSLELAAVVTVALETGLRISELVTLTADQIDFDKGLITIEQQKNGKRSVLPLSQKALETLSQSLPGEVRRGRRVFLRQNGQAWTDSLLRQHFYRAATAAGLLSCRFHDLRHTFATRLLERGVSMHTVQKLGRWSSVTMLNRYGHYDVEGLRQALDNK